MRRILAATAVTAASVAGAAAIAVAASGIAAADPAAGPKPVGTVSLADGTKLTFANTSGEKQHCAVHEGPAVLGDFFLDAGGEGPIVAAFPVVEPGRDIEAGKSTEWILTSNNPVSAVAPSAFFVKCTGGIVGVNADGTAYEPGSGLSVEKLLGALGSSSGSAGEGEKAGTEAALEG